MTAVLLFIGIVLIAATAWLLVRAVALPRTRFALHLRQIDQYGFQQEATEENVAPGSETKQGPITKGLEGIGRLTQSAIPWLKPLGRGDLTAAGMYDVSTEAIHGLRTVSAVFLFVLVLVWGPSLGFITLIILVAAPVAGWFLPGFAIRQRGRQRLNAIDRDLPRLIDVLIATIEAGMGFAASLQLIADRFKGPMGVELKLMQREQGLGVSTEQALDNLVSRCDTPSVRAFARSLVHGQELGVSIGPILRNIAIDIRRRRRQAAREKIQKAPLKMLFPLILLIFPPLLIVILYPALYSILHTLAGG